MNYKLSYVDANQYMEKNGLTQFQHDLIIAVITNILFKYDIRDFGIKYIYDDSLGSDDLTIDFIVIMVYDSMTFSNWMENIIEIYGEFCDKVARIEELDGVVASFDVWLDERED